MGRIKVKEGNVIRYVKIPDRPVVISPAEAAGTKKKSNKKTGGK